MLSSLPCFYAFCVVDRLLEGSIQV